MASPGSQTCPVWTSEGESPNRDEIYLPSWFKYIRRETGDPRVKPSELMKERVVAGPLGIRIGRGWFDYSGKKFEELATNRDISVIKIQNFPKREGFYRWE